MMYENKAWLESMLELTSSEEWKKFAEFCEERVSVLRDAAITVETLEQLHNLKGQYTVWKTISMFRDVVKSSLEELDQANVH